MCLKYAGCPILVSVCVRVCVYVCVRVCVCVRCLRFQINLVVFSHSDVFFNIRTLFEPHMSSMIKNESNS